mgnify:CR=1 FL=1
MADFHLFEISESLIDVSYEFLQFLFCGLFDFKVIFEVALVAELGDDIAIAFREEGFVKFEDVGVVHLLQYSDFFEDKFF